MNIIFPSLVSSFYIFSYLLPAIRIQSSMLRKPRIKSDNCLYKNLQFVPGCKIYPYFLANSAVAVRNAYVLNSVSFPFHPPTNGLWHFGLGLCREPVPPWFILPRCSEQIRIWVTAPLATVQLQQWLQLWS
jgi:hypothetical protein